MKYGNKGGVLASQKKGNTRIYTFNPRYAFLDELQKILRKAIRMLPKVAIKKYYTKRTWLGKAGKTPLKR